MDFSAVLDDELAIEPEVVEPQPPAMYDVDAVKSRLAAFDSEVDKMLAEAKSIEIKDDASRAKATNIAATAKKIDKAIEGVREVFKRPALEYGRAVDNLARNYQDRLKTVINEVKAKDRQYQAKLDLEYAKHQEAARKAQIELQKKIDAEAKKAGVEAPKVESPVIAPPPKAIKTEQGSITYRDVWKFRITDATKIPHEYLVVDESKIRQAVKNGVRNIDGVEIYSEKEPVLR